MVRLPISGPKDVLKLLIVGDSAVRLLITLGARSAWWKAAEKTAHWPKAPQKGEVGVGRRGKGR